VVVAALRLEGNVGQPHELAAMGLFLASDDTSYVNGQAIPVDGGHTASTPYAGKPISIPTRHGRA
jgi:NAD(P)-dependent dehydrogenase (short-subunit alcohol dehydrogenase family)